MLCIARNSSIPKQGLHSNQDVVQSVNLAPSHPTKHKSELAPLTVVTHAVVTLGTAKSPAAT
jgi:hypothetical protein